MKLSEKLKNKSKVFLKTGQLKSGEVVYYFISNENAMETLKEVIFLENELLSTISIAKKRKITREYTPEDDHLTWLENKLNQSNSNELKRE